MMETNGTCHFNKGSFIALRFIVLERAKLFESRRKFHCTSVELQGCVPTDMCFEEF